MSLESIANELVKRLQEIWHEEPSEKREIETRAAYREFLVKTWCIFKNGHLPDIKGLNEAEAWLRAKRIAPSLAARLRERKPLSQPSSNSSQILALVFAVDEVAAECDIRINGSQGEAEIQYSRVKLRAAPQGFCKDFHVFLDTQPSPAPEVTSARKQSEPYAAINRHRIIPCKVGGIDVRFEFSTCLNDAAIGDSGAIRIYTGCYATRRDWSSAPQMKVDGQTIIKYFSPSDGLDRPARERELREHLRQALQADAQIVLLPELTVSEDIVADIQAALYAERGVTFPISRHDAIILPGTYHKEEGRGDKSRKQNVALILTASGGEIARQNKLKRYKSADVPNRTIYEEDIDGGSEIVVCHHRGLVFATLICIDFCDLHGAREFSMHTEVPFILVPSMGEAATINAHERRCGELRYYGKSTVVIAQECLVAADNEGDEPGRLGWMALNDKNKFECTHDEPLLTSRVWQAGRTPVGGA